MPVAIPLEKARLVELEPDFETVKSGGRSVFVQFNPESLKVSFANQVQQPQGGGDSGAPPSIQFVGAGTTKLTVQLWFDATAPIEARALPQAERGAGKVDDVRKLTQEVAWFITPQLAPKDKKKFVPPAVAFFWGTFQFNGMIDSMDESLEFFAPEGKPLRAQVSLAMSQPRISAFKFAQPVGRPDAAPRTPLTGGGSGATAPGAAGAGSTGPGAQALTAAPTGASLQQMAAASGQGGDWRAIAQANGIENPRLLAPGQLINLNIGRG
ncbi:hypothetical protein GCM10025771_11830 [Niveibacterium umoris]|uniref:Contractile injection system tube protein N-terminal domain-containing protein n=1 Tax=Niveibacterium umoris TaxID=1193620 RepID=A0A840BNM4_9RHOO|nr:peptidoglycan-binding protein [Niveibacterium umoris]MBB4013262.1 hypothetical protein [Niveibacterium umoris]